MTLEIQKLISHRNFNSIIKKSKNYSEFLLSNYNTSNLNEAIFLFRNNLDIIPTCELDGCSNHQAFYDKGTPHKYLRGCCKEHTMKLSMLETYGVDNIFKLPEYREKAKQTIIETYGVDNISKLPEYREKAKDTMLETYGVDHPLKSEKIKQQIITTNLEKYGTPWAISSDVIRNKSQQTLITNYGVLHNSQIPEIKEKKKQTSLKKFGTSSPLANIEIRTKSKQTLITNYGVYHNSQIESVKEKKRNTSLIEYGTTHIFSSNLIKEQIRNTNLFKYGVKHISQSETIMIEKRLNFITNKLDILKDIVQPSFNINAFISTEQYLTWTCSLCNNAFIDHLDNGHIPRCKKCYPNKNNSGKSYLEDDLFDSILITNKFRSDRKILNGKELDIYIPSKNLAIEFNGIYWHSELNGTSQNYHLDKTIKCEEQDIQLIHVFESEWLKKKNIVLSIIHEKLEIFDKIIDSTLCTIKEISEYEKNSFLEENNIFGTDESTIFLGLYYYSELVTIMTFGKSNIHQYTLYSYCTRLNYQALNGYSKLWEYFINHYNPDSIETYVDRRYSNGELFINLGFSQDSLINPQAWYFGKDIIGLQPMNPSVIEWEYMKNNGYNRIWDCGYYKFTWFR